MKMIVVLFLCAVASGQIHAAKRHQLSGDCSKALKVDMLAISDDQLSRVTAEISDCSQASDLTKDERIGFSRQASLAGFELASRVLNKGLEELKAIDASKGLRIHELESANSKLSTENEDLKQKVSSTDALVNTIISQPRSANMHCSAETFAGITSIDCF